MFPGTNMSDELPVDFSPVTYTPVLPLVRLVSSISRNSVPNDDNAADIPAHAIFFMLFLPLSSAPIHSSFFFSVNAVMPQTPSRFSMIPTVRIESEQLFCLYIAVSEQEKFLIRSGRTLILIAEDFL
jgi:hypothetical protein